MKLPWKKPIPDPVLVQLDEAIERLHQAEHNFQNVVNEPDWIDKAIHDLCAAEYGLSAAYRESMRQYWRGVVDL